MLDQIFSAFFSQESVNKFERNTDTGEIAQKTLKAGCVAIRTQRNCARGRSPGGRELRGGEPGR